MTSRTGSMVAVLALAIAMGDPAGADEAKQVSEPAEVEPWVGGWSGKLTWKGCSDDGATQVALDVGVGASGGLTSDGDALLDGVGPLAWVRRGKVLAVDGAEVDATLTLAKKGARLVVETAAGCVGKGTLIRETSGIAACDAVRALATVKAQCAGGDDLRAVEEAWASWSGLRGKKKTAQGKACTRQRDLLRLDVASCASAPAWASVFPECHRYVTAVERFARCDKVPQASRDATRQGLDAMVAAFAGQSTIAPEAVDAANDACRQAVDALTQGATAMGCTL